MSILVTTIILLAAIVMIVAIFFQPAKGNGFVGGGASQGGAMGSSGGTSFLFNVTMWCAAIIMVGALFLSWRNVQSSKSSVLDTLSASEVAEPQLPANTSPVTNQSAEPDSAPRNSPDAPETGKSLQGPADSSPTSQPPGQ